MESSKKLVAMFLVCIVVLSYSVHVSNAADEDSARRFVDKAHADYAACFNDCDEDCTHQGLGFTFCEVKCDEDCTDQLLKASVDDRETDRCFLEDHETGVLRSIISTSLKVFVRLANKALEFLHTAFANESHTRIISLQDQFACITKDSWSVTDYLRDIRSIADELAIGGAPITYLQLTVRILQALGPEYNAISAAIRSRETIITYEELCEKLLDHVIFLKQEEAKWTPPPTVITQRNN
ncbi:putative cyclic nucleotide-gated ion channel 1-like [Capsicum annuum]|nr:putative cyclic nucleotide-gated ion channel 1-like [Capsicum annuum]